MNPKTLDTLRYFPVAPEVAWQRYLEATRAAAPADYERVEQDAWAQLQVALSRVRSEPEPVA